jgi:hypothetical protein
MSFFDKIRRRGRGLNSIGGREIRDIVEESLEETEVTSELVERATDAHERAQDLMRQGLFEDALTRFRESIEAWEEQAEVCRVNGFKNLWKGKPQQVGREMEDLRITHLDVLDTDSFQFLDRRARLRRNQLAQILSLASIDKGTSEKDIHEEFPREQREEVRAIIFHSERRGWLRRENIAGHYYLQTTDSAPEITVTD